MSLSTFARFLYRRRRLVVAGWFAVFAIGMALYGAVVPRLKADTGGSRSEAAQVADRLEQIQRSGPEVVAVVGGMPVDTPAVRDSVMAVSDAIAALPHVVQVTNWYDTNAPPLVATDGRASLVIVGLDPTLEHDDASDLAATVAERLRTIDAPDVHVGGMALIDREFQSSVEQDLQRGESIALPIAFVAMIVIFGGLVAAGMPLIIAFTGVAGSMIVLFVATALTDVSVYALNVVFMFGIGLGIDYGLLLVSRFKEERGRGISIAEAVERTVATAGRTVVFSALTVAAALCGLLAFGDETFTAFAIAGIGVVLAAAMSAVTLLPALLGMWGRRLKPAQRTRSEHGVFHRLAMLVQRRAGVIVVVVGLGLAALAVPFLGARFEGGDARYLPRGSEARTVAETLADRFPSRGTEPLQVIVDADRNDRRVTAAAERWRDRPDVADVRVRTDTPDGVAVVEVVPHGTNQSDAAQRLVRTVRNADIGAPKQVGGVAAALVDTKDHIASRLPVAFAVMTLATLVLLYLMTGSVAVPVKAVIMNLLSLGASFGGLVWVFQEGHLSNWLGFDPTGSLDLFMPVLIFIFAFGLSMDYEVFLLSRIKEIHDATGDNDRAVALGLQRTGRIVTSAALLIVVVFAGFASGRVLGIKQLGFGLALAVIVDATVVRALLVPATMKLLGEWNWWAPRPLRRFHERFGLHEAPDEPLDGSEHRIDVRVG